jgi:sugar-specific transcriptional regulator TrmB
MDSELINSLQTYGFSDKEARIYLTCLELGSSLASTIARRAEINRGTAYSILEDFKRRGIVSENTKDELKYFSVLSPEALFRREEEKYEKMKSSLPNLLAIADKFGNRPRTQFFE